MEYQGRYQLDWVVLKLRYGLSLGIQSDQHLLALSSSALSVLFSKSISELQLNMPVMMEVPYKPYMNNLRNIFIKGTCQW